MLLDGGRMLLDGGRVPLDGGGVGATRLLSVDSVRQLSTDHLTEAQRAGSALFLEGQGWGFGGSVDIAAIDAWNVPGRYGWVGGTGTAGHICAATGQVTILLTQVGLPGPATTGVMHDFWRYAAGS